MHTSQIKQTASNSTQRTSFFQTTAKHFKHFVLFPLVCISVVLTSPGISGSSSPAAISTVMTARAEDLGMWYIDEFGVNDAHAAGIDGTGIKIADIDTMINTDVPWLADTNLVIRDKNITTFYGDISPITDDFEKGYHATDMISVLQGNGQGATNGNAPIGIVPGATIYHYSAVHSEDDSITGGDIYDEAVRLALEDDVDIIIIPAGGLSFYDRQYPYILEAIKRGIPVLIAHSNELLKISQTTHPEYYQDSAGADLPVEDCVTSDPDDEICYWPGMVTVQCIGNSRQLQIISDIADPGTDIASPGENIWMQFYNWGNFEPSGGGCSTATTVAGGYLTLAMQKWPDATGNQILQLLVTTAGGNNADGTDVNAVIDITRDPKFGFGIIDLEKMLNTDPTEYVDVNPILYSDIYRTVKNAEARGVLDTLTDNENLIEIATVLDEQLQKENLARPDFLVTLLGESETVSDDSTVNSSASQAATTDASLISDSTTTTVEEGDLSSGPRNIKKSKFPIVTITLCGILGLGLIASVIIIIRSKGKKNADKSEEES